MTDAGMAESENAATRLRVAGDVLYQEGITRTGSNPVPRTWYPSILSELRC
jgi:hypothetical protein